MSTTESTDLLALLGPSGVAALLGVAWCLLCAKFPKLRRRTARALHRAARAAWQLLWRELPLLFHKHRPSRDERRVMRRLHPHHWKRHAHERGLAGTITARPRLSSGGITTRIRLDGHWTPGKLRAAEDHIRALLGLRAGWRVEIGAGKRGGWAEITVRSRSAVPARLPWRADVVGIGLCTVTGEPVTVPAGRLLVAGSSGAGKSVSLRPLLAPAAADPVQSIVLFDLKRTEAGLWAKRARVARTPEEAEQAAAELRAEMMERLELLERKGSATWAPTAERPRLVAVVDEGAELVALSPRAVADLESVARMGRAAAVDLWWCTQKPTMSGSSAGIPPQIAAQMDVRLALRLATASEVRTVLGEDATGAGWDAHVLPKPGVLLLRGTGREPWPVKVWHMTDEQVRALPAAPIWSRIIVEPPVDGPGQPEDAAPAAHGRVLAALRDGVEDVPGLVAAVGLSRATVNRVLAALVEAGDAVRTDRGRYAVREPAAV